MKIILNTTTSHKGGSVQVAISLLNEFRQYKENDYYVFIGPSLLNFIRVSDFPNNFYFHTFECRPSQKVFSLRPLHKIFQRLERTIKPDCVVTTSGPSYWRPSCPHLIGYNLPHYIYSDSPYWRIIGPLVKLRFYLRKYIIRYFFKKDADYYFVQTDDVKERLKSFIKKEEISTIPNACSFVENQKRSDKKFLPAKVSSVFRFVTLSAYYKHKNLEIIGEVANLLERRGYINIEFIVTLGEADFIKCFGKNPSSKIINLGPINPSDCYSLYSECDALILPTLLECFSANYVEAMFMRKPILTSNLSFAKCICRDAAVYFNPLDKNDIVQKVINLVENLELISKLCSNGILRLKDFPTPQERASAILNLAESLISK